MNRSGVKKKKPHLQQPLKNNFPKKKKKTGSQALKLRVVKFNRQRSLIFYSSEDLTVTIADIDPYLGGNVKPQGLVLR